MPAEITDLLGRVMHEVLLKGELLTLIYFFAVNGWYLVLLVSAALEMRRHVLLITDESRHLLLGSTLSPGISILAPAYNEEATIEGCTWAHLELMSAGRRVCFIRFG